MNDVIGTVGFESFQPPCLSDGYRPPVRCDPGLLSTPCQTVGGARSLDVSLVSARKRKKKKKLQNVQIKFLSSFIK